jgi:Domain of unknown function (DUF6265)
MKALLFLATLVVGYGTQSFAATMADVSFLAGCWSVQDGSSTQTESWTKPTENLMLGIAQRKNANNQTEEYEFLRIDLKSNGEIFYTPYINGNQASDFKFDPAISYNNQISQKAVFANEANDFPKRILYQKDAATPEMINLRLEGQGQDGKELVIEFPMFTSDCNASR